MIYARIVTCVLAASWITAAPGNNYVQWLDIKPAKDTFSLEKSWEMFKTNLHKKYENAEEETYRRSIFAENANTIDLHNQKYKKGETTYWMGLNHFSDLTSHEFRRLHTGSVKMRQNRGDFNCSSFRAPSNIVLPDEVDWVQKGYVTEINYQTGAMEGQVFRKTGNLFSFSQQQLIDCSRPFQNHGCEGGNMDNAFAYIKKYGIQSAEDGDCVYNASKVVAMDTGCVDIESGNESALKEAVATVGPIAVFMDANHQSFIQYSGGVFQDPHCQSADLDHAVLIVGYGRINGTDYWLGKNSWGYDWGDNGYFKIARNKGNMCGIASEASYPIV